MRIAITNTCNSNCPYCFAGDMHINKATFMSINDLVKILDWMVREGDNQLVLLGGEPTIHPQFEDILKLVNNYTKEHNITTTILTNGVNLSDFTEYLNNDLNYYCLNINSKIVLGPKNYKKLIESISIIEEKYHMVDNNKMFFGCNLHYEANHDYKFFWDIVDKFNCKLVRVLVASPQNNEYINNRDAYFKLMKDDFINFIRTAHDKYVNVVLDCNQIPQCYFNNAELKLINLTVVNIENLNKCQFWIYEILPDLTISTCFGNSEAFKAEKRQFNFDYKLDDLAGYYSALGDNAFKINHLDKCRFCMQFINNTCLAGCLGFKDKVDI